MIIVLQSGFSVAAENVNDLVMNDRFNVCTAVAQILSGIEMIGMLHEVLADTCSQTQTKVGVNVDLADSAFGCLTKLFFRNTDGILQSAAVSVDDLNIFLRNRG